MNLQILNKNPIAVIGLSVWAVNGVVPAQAMQNARVSQPLNEEVYASVGDNLVWITIKEPLPNAFGGSDIFGRKREKGFVEVRFMGMAADGRALFRRRTVDVVSNETTTSRSRSLFPGSSIDQSGSGANAAIIIEGNDGAGMQVLPPNTIELLLI